MNENIMRIRSYDLNDARQLLNLLLAFDVEENHRGNVDSGHSTRESRDLEKVLHELRKGEKAWALVADLQGALRGYAHFHLYENTADPFRKEGSFEILSFYVNPIVRRKWVGTHLISNSLGRIKVLKQSRIGKVISEVRLDNEPSKALYQKLGFKPMQRVPGYSATDRILYSRRV